MSISPKHFGISDSIIEATKKVLDPVGKADADINNDGKVDSSDDYLRNRRKAISKAMKSEEVEQVDEEVGHKYPMTYAKYGSKKLPNGKTQLTKHIKHTHVMMSDKPSTPERAKYSVANSPEHKKLKSAGYRITHYGSHAKDVTHERIHGNKPVYEEIQLDELSPQTKVNYVSKALKNKAGHDFTMGKKSSDPMSPAFKKAMAGQKKRDAGIRMATKSLAREDVELTESHFKVGDKVECIASGMKGEVVKVDAEEKGKYYTVKRDDGKMMKYAPDELKAVKQMDEADDPVAKQIAAKKEQLKKQIQQKIAQKQMSVMQRKAQKKMQDIKASNDKDEYDDSKMKKGKQDVIELEPELKESELPKAVVKKGHDIAKSLIKKGVNVDEPYAVGMATAKKSAGIK